MTQAVHVRVGHALHAVATHSMRLGDGDASLKEQFDDLVVVGVGGQDDGGDVRGEVGELFVQQDRWHLVQTVNRWGWGTNQFDLVMQLKTGCSSPDTAGAKLIVWTCLISLWP